MSDSLRCDRLALAALHGPHPALVQEVTRQGGQGGWGRPVGCHAEGHSAVGRLREVLHVENEGNPEVQRQLVIPVAICSKAEWEGLNLKTTSWLKDKWSLENIMHDPLEVFWQCLHLQKLGHLPVHSYFAVSAFGQWVHGPQLITTGPGETNDR